MNDTTSSSTLNSGEFELPREMGKLAGYNLLCSEFNLGTEQFDVCGAIVLRIGTAAYAGKIHVCQFHPNCQCQLRQILWLLTYY